jgi:EmrB/QacA subfamily drug resistance transporter
MSNRTRNIITTILLTACFIILLNQTSMTTIVPLISKIFGTSLTLTQWITSGYVLMIGLVAPLSAIIYEKYSSRQAFTGIMVTFIVGTILGLMANNFWLLLVARLIQAIAGGIFTTFVQISLITINPIEKRGEVMGLMSLVISAGPALGPSVSGALVQLASWRIIFGLILPLMVILLVLGIVFLPNYSAATVAKIDFLSAVTSMVGMGSIMVGLTILSTNLLLALALMVIGLVVALYFVQRQNRLAKPLLTVKLMTQRRVLLMTMMIMLVFGILMGTESVMPIYFENVRHASTMVAGLVLLPGALVNAVLSPFIGRLYDQYGAKYLLLIGGVVLLLSSIPLIMIKASSSVVIFVIDYLVRMVGISMLVSTGITESLKGLPREAINHATALNNTLRQISGSALTTIMIMAMGIPQSLVVGTRVAIWITVLATVLLILINYLYLRGEQANANR